MSFTLQTLATIGGATIDAPTVYTYKTIDALAVVIGTGYFDDKKHEFEPGDVIHLLIGSDSFILVVTLDTSTVKIMSLLENIMLPLTAFGELAVAETTPVVQLQFPYNINTGQVVSFPGNGGSVTNGDGHANVSSGTSSDGFALVLSRDVIKYNSGQGALARFTAKFTTGVADSEQIAGAGNNLNGFFFGYDGADFGVLRRTGGQPAVRTLTITTASTTAENVTITLDGDADATVAVTNSNDACITAREIAAHSYASLGVGWGAFSVGNTVVFISLDTAVHSGSYSLSSATTAIGSFATTITGVPATDSWTNQEDWSVDKMDGTGASGVALDTTKGNVYQIRYQWLGYGLISFYVENPSTGEFQLVHKIEYANAHTAPSLDNPTLPLTLEVRNFGNTSNLTISSSSMSGFIEGKERDLGPNFGADRLFTIGNVTSEEPILTIRNKQIYQGSINQVRVLPEFITLISNLNDARADTTFRIYIDATGENGCSYSDISTSSSVVEVDTTSADFDTSESTKQFTFITTATQSLLINLTTLRDKLNPRSTLMITAQPSKAHATNEVGATINWKELF